LESNMTICENLKGFASSRPPLVMFMMCLGAFAIVLISLSHYFKFNDIYNPDLTEVSWSKLSHHWCSHIFFWSWVAEKIATNMTDIIDINRTINKQIIACYNEILLSAYLRLFILCNIFFLDNNMPYSWRDGCI
jgi:hypothetical protein